MTANSSRKRCAQGSPGARLRWLQIIKQFSTFEPIKMSTFVQYLLGNKMSDKCFKVFNALVLAIDEIVPGS